MPAYAGVPLTDRQGARRAVRRRAPTPTSTGRSLGAGDATVVVLGARRPVAAAAGELVAAGRKPDTPVTVTGAGTTTEQRTVVSTLDRIAADAEGGKVLRRRPAVSRGR